MASKTLRNPPRPKDQPILAKPKTKRIDMNPKGSLCTLFHSISGTSFPVPGHNTFVWFGKKVPCPGQTLLVSFSNSNSSRLGGFNFSDEPGSLAGVDWWRVWYRLGGAASLLSSNLSEHGLGSSRAQDRSGLAWVSALDRC
ncbi:hypothetical protein OIU84_018486 [Salix udensis]|uniref:Uncharacterized protein n=1 Tax=Salix udensis TaxID=889485 RepID=A0AAD6KWJ5_9ROSI|nr:hypothetical protein OIU84_018486 [Salix udensis]